MVQHRVFKALLLTGGAADDQHWHLFGKGFGSGIGHLQAAYTVSHAHHPQSIQAGVGIGGETRALLVAGVDGLERAAVQLLVKAEHIVARNAEDVPHAVRVEPLDEIFADGGCSF